MDTSPTAHPIDRFLPQLRKHYPMFAAQTSRGVVHLQDQMPFYTGYDYGVQYDWDQYFELICQLYAGYSAYFAKNAVRRFLEQQREDGFIGRTSPVYPWAQHDHVKPFLAQTVWLITEHQQTHGWLTRDLFDRLKKYLDHWLVGCDVRGRGLSVWANAAHSGMDNHYRRAGRGNDSFCEGVDLNCFIVRDCRAFAALCRKLGEPSLADDYDAHADARARAIRTWCWDDAAGLFKDYHAREDRPIDVSHVGTFLPLWAHVATEAQADALIDRHLLNPAEYWRPWPLPALPASSPDYVEGFAEGEFLDCCSWKAHTWVPTNYLVMHGLKAYGRSDLAQTLADKTLGLFMRGPFSEYYTSEGGIGTGLKPFRGWSSLALFMPAELHLGTDPTDLPTAADAIARMRRLVVEQVE